MSQEAVGIPVDIVVEVAREESFQNREEPLREEGEIVQSQVRELAMSEFEKVGAAVKDCVLEVDSETQNKVGSPGNLKGAWVVAVLKGIEMKTEEIDGIPTATIPNSVFDEAKPLWEDFLVGKFLAKAPFWEGFML